MCGIAGIWDFNNGTSRNTLVQEVSAMADRLHSRGPDSTGYWVDEEICIALSHRRLAIQDLSSNGNQPFFIPDIFSDVHHELELLVKINKFHLLFKIKYVDSIKALVDSIQISLISIQITKFIVT